jgi:hypothetical protein
MAKEVPVTDWTTQAADVIENAVTAVRDKTVEPATKVVRITMFGLLAALLLTPAMLLFGILVFRVLFLIHVRGFAVANHPWLPYGIVSVVCLLGGVVCMAKRRPKTQAKSA